MQVSDYYIHVHVQVMNIQNCMTKYTTLSLPLPGNTCTASCIEKPCIVQAFTEVLKITHLAYAKSALTCILLQNRMCMS